MNAIAEKVKTGKIDINEKQNVQYCIPIWLRDEQIKHALARVKGRIEPSYADREGPIAVVCFGPSLNDTWEQIKNFKYVMSCSGSHKFLVDHGIIPTWHVEVDPREHKIKLIGQPQKETEYLIASTCHPKVFDHLEGYNVKLWNVFDGEADALRTLPQGEWALFGGSSVGLRALTISRFLGFKDLHVFGMDGNFGKSGKHAAEHPNQPPGHQLTEYRGRTYEVTPSTLECCKQTFHELDQMPDVKAKFYGEGLCQEMAKDYVPKQLPKGTPTIGYHKVELISPAVKELNSKLHKENLAYGVGGKEHAKTIIKFKELIKAESVGDYGCGKGLLAKALPFPCWEYDPCIPGKEEQMRPVDLLVCTDVLEHIEPEKIADVLQDIKRCIKKAGYLVINTKPAKKKYADGRNTHLLQKDRAWWEKALAKFFQVGKVEDIAGKLHIIVGPKPKEEKVKVSTVASDPITAVGEAKFYTPNQTTKWRAETLLVKEPITIQWINSMTPGEILFDVGANVGGYTVLAGKRGVKVYAFEPEAENFALLNRNIRLNEIDARAYCVALAGCEGTGVLNLSQTGVGGSCHTYDKEATAKHIQGSIVLPLSRLTEDLGLPVPNHIKIDVDGLESNVVSGIGKWTLSNKDLKSILIEIDTKKESHQEIIKTFKDQGFDFDQEQVNRAMRTEGAFKGIAEFLFKRISIGPLTGKEDRAYSVIAGVSVSESSANPTIYTPNVLKSAAVSMSTENNLDKIIANKIARCKVSNYPTPYIFIENVFPEALYKDLLNNLPDDYVEISKARGVKGYKERLVSLSESFFWKDIDSKLRTGVVKTALCDKFGITNDYVDETLLIRDLTGYAIGPHTDSPAKVISALFYLPEDESQIEAGTSLYLPKDKDFKCAGGPHHKFEYFDKITTVPFKPNSLFAFLKTDTSFHGVEKYTGEKPRDVLLYDIRRS